MTDPFVHLHVASGYSLQHGASHPEALVERAAEHGMDALALTDRDGVYGAVKFAKACLQAGIRPILGVDLAVDRPRSVSFLQAAPGGSHEETLKIAQRTGVGAARRAAERRWTCGSRGSPRSRSAGRAGLRYAGSPAPPICVANAASRSAPSTCWPSTRQISTCCSARTPTSAQPWPPAASTWPSSCSRGGGRWSPVTGCCSRSSPTAARSPCPARTPRGCSGSPPSSGCRRCSPTWSGMPTATARPPPTSSTPPVDWSPSTPGTSTGSTPRAT